MNRRKDERHLRDVLGEVEAPDKHRAEERSRKVVAAAFEEREPQAQGSRIALRTGLALTMGGVIAALALTPAGAEVRDWIADRFQPGEENAETRLTSLPTPGAVLVETQNGTWLIREDGSKRRLGDFDETTWSPSGKFVGVTDGSELRAIDPVGNFRWSIDAGAPVTDLDWSSDEGFRVAYLADEEVRVVTGDGLSESFASPARPVGPAWQPESDPDEAIHHLSFVDRDNRVVTVDTDTSRVIWRTRPFAGSISLEWSDSGRRLLVSGSKYVVVLQADGTPLTKGPFVTGLQSAAISPSGDELVAVTRGREGTELNLLDSDGSMERLYTTGRKDPKASFGEPVFSPDGEWVLLPWPEADQWLFVNTEDRRVTAVADITRQFDSDDKGDGVFPEVAGWCC